MTYKDPAHSEQDKLETGRGSDALPLGLLHEGVIVVTRGHRPGCGQHKTKCYRVTDDLKIQKD